MEVICILKAFFRVTVLLGHYNKYETTKAILRDSEKIIIHEKYDHWRKNHHKDTGLIKLAGPEIPVAGNPGLGGM